MNELLKLEPRELWKHFHSLTCTPRPSGHEAQVRKFVSGVGKERGLETIVDDAGNVIIRKPATPGLENRKGVILQAHLDMVPQKNSDSEHDFTRDPIATTIENGWVKAVGTTLGADNGIGVAAALAVLESETIEHGPIEALFTANEEAGMTGALGLRPGTLKGTILMNLDSEDEGELFIGCAGGMDAIATFDCGRSPLPSGYAGLKIAVTGLKGGHSGMDIDLGRGNANKIMNRLLLDSEPDYGVLLSSIEGGSLRNAIPRESFAHVAVPENRTQEFLDSLNVLADAIRREFAVADPGLRIEAVNAEPPDSVIDPEVADRLFKAIQACPNGVMRMSTEMDGLVETSNNLAMVKTGEKRIVVECLLRSSVNSAREDLQSMIGSLFALAGATICFEGGYPGWKPDQASPILKVMRETYASKFGNWPEVRAVHAGLECGIIGGKYPGLDMISFGPTIRHPHSPGEKVEIASVGRFWEFLTATLAAVPDKESDE